MRPPIDGATILITGASSGIGEAMARQLGPRAGTLILVARRAERLEALSEELTADNPKLTVVVEPADLTDREATDAMLDAVAERAGDVDALINNAGFGDLSVYDQSSWERIERMIALNVTALSYLTHRLLPKMVEKGRGGVLNVSSGAGYYFLPGFAAYAGTKHYVTGFTEGLRLDLKSAGVVVTQSCPGPVATEFEANVNKPVDQSVPSFLEISADTCARQSLRAFERGRAVIMPGFLMRWLMRSGLLMPKWFLRLFFAPVAKKLRSIQLAKGAG